MQRIKRVGEPLVQGPVPEDETPAAHREHLFVLQRFGLGVCKNDPAACGDQDGDGAQVDQRPRQVVASEQVQHISSVTRHLGRTTYATASAGSNNLAAADIEWQKALEEPSDPAGYDSVTDRWGNIYVSVGSDGVVFARIRASSSLSLARYSASGIVPSE